MTYRDFRFLLKRWFGIVSRHGQLAELGDLMLFGYEQGPIKSLMMDMPEVDRGSRSAILEVLDEEFRFSDAGQGLLSWRSFIGHSRSGVVPVDDAIRTHEHLYRRMCRDVGRQGVPQGRRQRRERFRIPDVLRAYILVDAMNLSDDQFEKVVTVATDRQSEEVSYATVRAAVKRLFGREARVTRKRGTGQHVGKGGSRGAGAVHVAEEEDTAEPYAEDELEEFGNAQEEDEEEGGDGVTWEDEDGNLLWAPNDGSEGTQVFIAMGPRRKPVWKPFKPGKGRPKGGGCAQEGRAGPGGALGQETLHQLRGAFPLDRGLHAGD